MGVTQPAPGPAQATAERILMVSPYAPWRDGIGAYAVQQVRGLRRLGHHVEVVSPYPSAAHHHLDLVGPRGALALGRLARRFDRVVVQFHPDVFYRAPATPGSRMAEGLALGAVFRAGPPVEIRLHEVDHRWADRSDPSARASRFLFQSADRVSVHVPEHEVLMVDAFGVAPARVERIHHGVDFVRRIDDDRAAARAALDLPSDDHVFVCIGFIQPHKGFDRAVQAFRGLAERGASLHVVGSVRVDDPQAADHLRELELLERQVPGVHLHLGFVSDDAFDRWLVAADTVVLPYRHIWSSSVAERAALYRRPVIATRVGGLAAQLHDHPGATLVDDNAGLAVAMRAALGGSTGDDLSGSGGWLFDGPADASTISDEIRRRAAAARGAPLLTRAAGQAGRHIEIAPSAPLRRVRPVPPPAPVSARPGVSVVKKAIRRLIAWEIDPLRDQLNRLQRAAVDAVDAETDLVMSREPGGDDSTAAG
jgi:glycosyltransferase involved in cell wall biosynthesis